MLHCDAVIQYLETAKHPVSAGTMARRLGLKRKEVVASLLHARNFIDTKRVAVHHRSMHTKRPLWILV